MPPVYKEESDGNGTGNVHQTLALAIVLPLLGFSVAAYIVWRYVQQVRNEKQEAEAAREERVRAAEEAAAAAAAVTRRRNDTSQQETFACTIDTRPEAQPSSFYGGMIDVMQFRSGQSPRPPTLIHPFASRLASENSPSVVETIRTSSLRSTPEDDPNPTSARSRSSSPSPTSVLAQDRTESQSTGTSSLATGSVIHDGQVGHDPTDLQSSQPPEKEYEEAPPSYDPAWANHEAPRQARRHRGHGGSGSSAANK